MADNEILPLRQAPGTTSTTHVPVSERSEVSNFLHVKVKHPLTREAIVEAIDQALRTSPVLPTFHGTKPMDIQASSSEEGLDASISSSGPSQSKDALLMLVQEEGNW